MAVLVALAVLFSCAWFFSGGGSNQNAHLATVIALVEDRSLYLDRYAGMTGDLAAVPGHVVSAKPIATALAALPAYLVARAATAPVKNQGNRFIIRGYVTSVFTSGLALAALAAAFYHLFRRRLSPADSAFLALGMTIATPLFPNSTMLTSHPLASLSAVLSYTLLERRSEGDGPASSRALGAAGAFAGLSVCFEYQSAFVFLPLAAYAAYRCGRITRLGWFGLGALAVGAIPAVHHSLVYGSAFRTGYSSLVTEKHATDASRGFVGFVPSEFSLFRLYHLTLGAFRGFFYLSPLLVLAIPGWVRMIRRRDTRPEGLATLCAALSVMLAVSTLVYWHSGSATGSRYALLFVTFCGPAVAAWHAGYRPLTIACVAVSFAFMLMGTSVTAMPPSPGSGPPYYNVLGFWWEHFSKGDLAFWQGRVVHIEGIGDGGPTMRKAFNLGQLLGLGGLASLLPYLGVLGALGFAIWRAARKASPDPPVCPESKNT
ncbi:MAG: hypothetical protein HY897_19860 [Deltaproteobacteria bacterium]|nr:hypothetical protein [Deltaproteobacteria bacterium]